MPRKPRNDSGGKIYHVLNRANNKAKIFNNHSDYALFENLLIKAVKRFNIKLFAYINMPNHFHFVLYTQNAGDMSRFMHWFSTTFTQTWHVHHGTTGNGHVFQSRYKSFLIKNDEHLLQVLLYIERNALKAGLVHRAESWRWGSAFIKKYGNKKQRNMLTDLPIQISKNYQDILNNIQ